MTESSNNVSEKTKPKKPRVPFVSRVYWAITHKELSADRRHAFWLWFGTILTTVFFSSAYPTFLYIQARDQVEELSIQVATKKSYEEFIALKMFTLKGIVYVVGPEAEYPRGTSEMAKDIKDLTAELNRTKQVADAALKQGNELEKVLGKLLKEERKKK